MATIGILDVAIRATTTDFEKGIKRADKLFRKFGGDLLVSAAKWGAAFGTGAAAGIGLLVKNSMQAIDHVAKLSDRLKISTESVIGLGHAAKLAGVDEATLTKSLEYLTKTMGTLALTGGQQADILAAFGLNVKELAAMAPDKAFAKVAEAISKQGSATAKATIATAAFGRSGTQLLNVLNLGSSGLADMAKEAESLGLMYDRVDASKVEQANDAVSKAIEYVTGLGNRIAIFLAPVVEYLSEQFIATGKDIMGAIGTGTEAFDWLEKAMQRVADVAHLVMAGIYALQASFDWMIAKILDGLRQVQRVRYSLTSDEAEGNAILKSIDGLEQLSQSWRDAGIAATESMSQQWEKINDGSVVQGLENVRKKMEAVGEASKRNLGFKPGDEQKFPELASRATGKATSAAAGRDMMREVANFQAISLSRVAIGTLSPARRKQEVHDPATEKIEKTVAAQLSVMQSIESKLDVD